jgi:AcrR family transcriptional regulator
VRVTTTGDPDVDAILEIYAMHPDDAPGPNESLRERKKRRLRQQISNMATAMFLAHGFDNVTVARIAAACEVSEQTVFNYFPTKESMFFDRSEPTISAVAPDEAGRLRLIRLFWDTVNRSPTLVAARFADLQRFVDEVSTALAQRIGADPGDPEVQLAALVIAGVLRVGLQSTAHHVQQATSIAALNAAVRRDFLKAAQLAEPTLTAFDNLRETAEGRGAAHQLVGDR